MRAFEKLEDWIDRGGLLVSPTIYSIEDRAFLPPACSDFRANKEHWFLEEKNFKRIGYIDLQNLYNNSEITITDSLNTLSGKLLLDNNLNTEVKKTKKKIKISLKTNKN